MITAKEGKPWFLLNHNENGAKPWLKPELEASGFSVGVAAIPTDIVWFSPVYQRCGAELKDIPDLLSSMDTANANMVPRLDDELRRLQEFVQLPFLITHGWAKWEHFAKDDHDLRWSLEAVDNLLVGRNLRGIVLARARNTKGEHGLSRRLISLHSYTQKALLDRLLIPRHFPYTGPLSERSEAVYALLARLRGLKNRKQLAEQMAAKHSISEIVAKEADDLVAMGLSKQMAKRFFALTHGKDA